MRKFAIFLLVLFPLISSCKKEPETDAYIQYKFAAWTYLTDAEKSSVIVDWKQASVNEIIFEEKKTFAVSFHTKDDALLGPITVYVDAATKVVVGESLRD
jgi:hypothetical protein